MPFRLSPPQICATCVYGHCISYIREQSKKMKDRDTQYRLSQAKITACAFDSWIPGGAGCPSIGQPFSYYLEQVEANAKLAGNTLETQPLGFFGKTEKRFFLTDAQLAKVRGDVFEMICRAILWNRCAENNRALKNRGASSLPFPIAAVTLGDNYDLRKLFIPSVVKQLQAFLDALRERAISLSYSTPDIIGVNIETLGADVIAHFSADIPNLSIQNQERLTQGRQLLEGKIRPEHVVFACGIKTSIRSDRMYQFLFEANAWKYIWRRVFRVPVCRYHSVMTQTFGADPEKLRSLDFSADDGPVLAERAIDSITTVLEPEGVSAWFDSVARELRGEALAVSRVVKPARIVKPT